MKQTLARKSFLLALPLLALAAAPARADEGEGGDPLPPSELPASDSPESTASIRVQRPTWQGSRKKIQTFLVPLDEKSRAPAARVAQALETLQGSLQQYEVVDLGRALKADATPEQSRHAAEGRKLLAEGNLLLAGRGYADATTKYRAALKELEKGLAALEPREYAEAWARLGTAQALAGEDKAARTSFAAAARHDPEGKLQVRNIDQAADARLAAGRADVEALPSGVVEVDSKPPGARVSVDGEHKGNSPMRLELPSGRHVIRIERAGYFPAAELIDVPAGGELAHQPSLRSTPRAADLYETMAAAADEATRGQVGASTARLADKFGLQRVYIGSVASHGSKVQLTLALVDVPKNKQVGKTLLLLAADGTDADQLEDQTREAARKLALQDPGDGVPEDLRPKAPGSSEPRNATAGRSVAVPADEVDIPSRDRRPATPASATETASVQQPASVERPVAPIQKKKPKKLKEKTGQEGWGED